MTEQQGSGNVAETGDSKKGKKEWWEQDRIDAIGWAAAFVWGAVVLVLEATGVGSDYSWWEGWAIFFTGAGAIVLIATVFRVLMPEYRSSWPGSLIFGLILLCIGLGDWAGWGWIWALPLFAIGVAILQSVLSRRH